MSKFTVFLDEQCGALCHLSSNSSFIDKNSNQSTCTQVLIMTSIQVTADHSQNAEMVIVIFNHLCTGVF